MKYRITYLRDNKPSGVTFWADNFVQAVEFVELWERLAKVEALTFKPLPNEVRSRSPIDHTNTENADWPWEHSSW